VSRLADFERIDPDWLGDVLELSRAEIADREIEPPLDLPIGLFGEADRARLGYVFQPRGATRQRVRHSANAARGLSYWKAAANACQH